MGSVVPVDGRAWLLPVPEDEVDAVVVAGGDITGQLHCPALHTPHNWRINMSVKGTVSRGFLLLVFSMNQFPPAQEYPIRPFQIF